MFTLAEARGPPLLGGTEPRLGGYVNGLIGELDGGNPNAEGGRSDCDLVCPCTGNEKLGLISHSNLVTDSSRVCEACAMVAIITIEWITVQRHLSWYENYVQLGSKRVFGLT